MDNNKSTSEVWVRTGNRTLVPIDNWEAIHLYFAENEVDVNFIFGKLIIRKQEEKAIVMEDRLEPLAQNLCIKGAKKLLTDEDYNFVFWDNDWTISLRIERDNVVITGDNIGPATFHKQKLISLLLECAAKIMALMQKLHIHYPEYNFLAFPYLDELFAECQKMYEDKYG